MPLFTIVLIPFINFLNLSWIKKMSILEEYGAFIHSRMIYKTDKKGLFLFVFLHRTYDLDIC